MGFSDGSSPKENGQLGICIDPQVLNKYLRQETHPMLTVEELLPGVRKLEYLASVLSRMVLGI